MVDPGFWFWSLVLFGFGVAVFVLLLCQGLCAPAAPGVYIVPVNGRKDLEYCLWLAEAQVQRGRCGEVLLVGIPDDGEARTICTLFMRRRPWIRCCEPEALDAGLLEQVCKSGGGVLY